MSTALLALGLALVTAGVLGVLGLPDLMLRLHAATKCGVTGAITVLLGLMLRAPDAEFVARLAIIIVFLVCTAPLVPHIIGLSASEQAGGSPAEKEEP